LAAGRGSSLSPLGGAPQATGSGVRGNGSAFLGLGKRRERDGGMPGVSDNPFHLALGVFLLLAACLGHLVLLIASHNCLWYGSGMHRRIVDVAQYTHALLLLASPVVFWLAFGTNLPFSLTFSAEAPWTSLLSGYVVACWLTAFVLLPADTVWRRRRARSAALLSNHTEVIDVAA